MAGPHKESPGSVGRQREQEENLARTFIVVSMGKNWQVKINRLTTG